LGTAYRYAIKIEQKLKQKMKQFGPGNPFQQKPGKGGPNLQNKGQRKYEQYQENFSNPQVKKDTEKIKKDIGKWCNFHKIPWNNTVDCRSKKSLVVEVKASESNAGYDFESKPKKGRWIIDMEPSATVATTKLQTGETDEPKQGERLFHS
jgi:hypothetical protein